MTGINLLLWRIFYLALCVWLFVSYAPYAVQHYNDPITWRSFFAYAISIASAFSAWECARAIDKDRRKGLTKR